MRDGEGDQVESEVGRRERKRGRAREGGRKGGRQRVRRYNLADSIAVQANVLCLHCSTLLSPVLHSHGCNLSQGVGRGSSHFCRQIWHRCARRRDQKGPGGRCRACLRGRTPPPGSPVACRTQNSSEGHGRGINISIRPWEAASRA